MDPLLFKASDWYWVVGDDESQVYTSARSDYVPSDDATYLAWVQDGKMPTRIYSAEDLGGVLAQWSAPVPLPPDVLVGYQAAKPPQVKVFAQARLAVENGEVTGAETAVGLGGAMMVAENVCWIFFEEVQPDTNYVEIIQVDSDTLVDVTVREVYFMELTFTNANGGEQPVTPIMLTVSVQRAT